MIDLAINQDTDYEVDYGTLTEELCQDCKNGYYIKCFVQDSEWDYHKTWTCSSCGSVESN